MQQRPGDKALRGPHETRREDRATDREQRSAPRPEHRAAPAPRDGNDDRKET